MSFVGGVSMTVGSFVVAAAISGDCCRFAKSRRDVVKSSVAGVLPSGLVVLTIAANLRSKHFEKWRVGRLFSPGKDCSRYFAAIGAY